VITLGKENSANEIEAPSISTKTWVWLTIYMIILIVLITVQSQFLPPQWGTGGLGAVGPSGIIYCAMPLPYVFSFVMLFVMSYFGVKIDRRTFALFYIATMVATWRSVNKGYANVISGLIPVRISTAEVHGYALPEFWLPSAEVVKGCFYHDSLHNLFVTYASEWIPVIATHIYWYTVATLFMMGYAIILRKLWVDIEVLPFPHAQGWITAEIALLAPEKKPDKRKKIFIVAAILAILFYVPYMVYSAYPGLPDPYGWMTGAGFMTWLAGAYDLSTFNPVVRSSIVTPIYIHTDPLRYAFPFLAPLDLLLSVWVGQMIFLFLAPQIAAYLGYYSGIFTADFWGKHGMIFFGEPILVNAIHQGLGVGIVVFMILLNWRYFADTIKRAVTRKTEPGEVSYSLGYLLLLVGGIGLVVLFLISGVGVVDAVTSIFIVITIQCLANARAHSHLGFQPMMFRGHWFQKLLWGPEMPWAPEFPADKLFVSAHVNHYGTGFDIFGPYFVTINGMMDSFKIGSMAKVHPKTIFKLCLIGALLGVVIVIPLLWIVWHAFGYMELPTVKEWCWYWSGDAGTYNQAPNVFLTVQGWLGFLLSGLLIFLRSRYIWWPIDPLGLFFASAHCSAETAMGFFTPLIVWIIKYILIKVGGRKMYDEVGLPAAFGVITGGTIGITIVGTINIIRYLAFVT